MSHDYKTSPTPKYRFFLFDPEPEWVGLMYFKSEAERDAAAKDAINAYKDLDNGWSEEVEGLCMGEVTHVCTQTNVVNRPLAESLNSDGYDEDGEYWGPDIELRCGYEMLPLLKPVAKPTAWRYRDASGTHFTEDFQEILNTSGIEEWTELVDAQLLTKARKRLRWALARKAKVLENILWFDDDADIQRWTEFTDLDATIDRLIAEGK